MDRGRLIGCLVLAAILISLGYFLIGASQGYTELRSVDSADVSSVSGERIVMNDGLVYEDCAEIIHNGEQILFRQRVIDGLIGGFGLVSILAGICAAIFGVCGD